MEREVRIRERAAESGSTDSRATRKPSKNPPTASSLLNNRFRQVQCSYCNENHTSTSCMKVSGVEARREILRKSGRCFICLRKNHISRNCRSSLKCSTCNDDTMSPSVRVEHRLLLLAVGLATRVVLHPQTSMSEHIPLSCYRQRLPRP